ncbi:hypothetical protein NEFER03_1220 [Nematocida sp. LUAm3]|nr:hypothetical protein NEFER03_1220 [Nematocida sp. LUAm3]KAI5175829.1 hypothetical protein NEFER02_1698 [Nematocida sp. LUAm2]KAI5178325.1 hypothetical protein NEFER01_1492 [Nematocida sp. LUAm1]
MSSVQLECQVFKRRVQKIVEAIGEEAGTLMIAIGKRDESFSYGINSAMFLYLLGYEFPETALIIRKEEILAVTSAKKSSILEQLKGVIKINCLVRAKDGSNQESIDQAIREYGKNRPIGVLTEERGPLVEKWINAQTTVDMREKIESLFMHKEKEEIETMKKAGICAVSIAELLESRIRQVVKADDRVMHEEIREKIEGDLEVEIKRLPKEIDQSYLELSFKPIIQSGGMYQIDRTEIGDYTNPYDEQLLYFDIILCYLGVGYKGYSSLIGRTLLVSPNEKALFVLQKAIDITEHIVHSIRKGRTFKEIKKEGRMFLEKNREDPVCNELLAKMKIEVGRSIGIRPEEGDKEVEEKEIEKGMVFVLSIQMENISELIEDKEASIRFDNVIAMEEEPKVLTPYKKDAKYYAMEKVVEQTKRNLLGRRLRNRDKELERANEITEHQKELMDELIEEQLGFWKEKGKEAPQVEKKIQKSSCYQKETQVPRGASLIKVDKRALSVIVPVFGVYVPFHIEMIKGATKTIEDGIGYLKLSFFPPPESTEGNTLLSLVIKESQENVLNSWKEINALKKNEEKEEDHTPEEGEQEELQTRNERVETLQNVYIRYDHRAGAKKNAASTVELHRNGLRYLKANEAVDVLFSNIKHMFYQGGTAEYPTIIYFKLHNAITIQGKKTNDVQFFRDCIANGVHDTRKTRNRPGGEDAEIYEEREEERMREEVNEAFHDFAERVSEASRIILEEPLSKGFYGVPYRQSVLIQSTSECLINITEYPFFVLPLREIEIVNFERRITGVSTCDMVFVLKDKTKQPVHIHSVSASDVPWLIDFIDSKNICFTETRVNIQWSNVLKSILEDPVTFYEGGAWAILQPSRETQSDEEEHEEASDVVDLDTTEEEEESDGYEISSEHSESGEYEEDEEEESEEDEDDDGEGSDSFVVDDKDSQRKKRNHID